MKGLKITRVFVLFTIIVSSLLTLEGAQAKPSPQIKSKKIALHFPKGFQLPLDIKSKLPSWVNLNADGSLPEILELPEDTVIPDTIKLPKRKVIMRTADEKTMQMQEFEAPEVQINLKAALNFDIYGAEEYSGGTLKKPANWTGWQYASSVWVGPTPDHCVNNARFNGVPISSYGFRGQSSLPTWTPSEGDVNGWNFNLNGPGTTWTQLCISRSLYWIYIATFANTNNWTTYFAMLSAYNNPNNWWVLWNG